MRKLIKNTPPISFAHTQLSSLTHHGSPEFLTDWTQNYSFDRYGNRTTASASGTSGGNPVPRDGYQSLAYDSTSNRITSSGFSYDPSGNQLTNGTGQSFIYDAAGRLAKVKDQNNATVASYTYGASNRRLITQTGNESSPTKTYYIWEGDSVITEYTDPSGAAMPQWSKNYIYFGARLLATEEPNNSGGEIVHYHHPDRLGTRLVTNNANTIVSKQTTLPFGTALEAESSGPATNRRFTSYDRSVTTGLDYAVNRHYDSRQGRFTQPDPLGLAAASLADPQSLNMYSYVGNDPMNRVDPDGQFFGALFRLIIGLFHNLKPNIINGSFAYHNFQPISVSFTTNFQNIGVGYGAFGIPLRSDGKWLPELLAPQSDRTLFDEAVAAARGLLQGDNPCSQFFTGAGLGALQSIVDTVTQEGRTAFGPLDNSSSIGIQMSIPTMVNPSSAPIMTTGLYGYVGPSRVIINTSGSFVRQVSFSRLPRFGGYDPGSLQSRVLELLHEIGHLIVTDVSFARIHFKVGGHQRYYSMSRLHFLLPHDKDNVELSERNTDEVLRHCRDQINALRP